MRVDHYVCIEKVWQKLGMYIEATRYSVQVYISQDYKTVQNNKSIYINEPRYTATPFLTFIIHAVY